MIEEWKDIKGYESLYQVSNLGRIKSLNYNHTKKEKIMSLENNKSGYLRVALHLRKKQRHYLVHRLVAEAFIPNPNNYACINHKDENKQNNNIDNLEWCTHKYNNCYGSKLLKSKKPINQYDKNGNFLKSWSCSKEASNYLKIDSSTITKCCRGKKKTCGGYCWGYKAREKE